MPDINIGRQRQTDGRNILGGGFLFHVFPGKIGQMVVPCREAVARGVENPKPDREDPSNRACQADRVRFMYGRHLSKRDRLSGTAKGKAGPAPFFTMVEALSVKSEFTK
jgi:hypothetical protein